MIKITIALLIAIALSAKHLHKEIYYQVAFCKKGIMEYTLPDNTRVDCITETHAIEIDHAYKWAEAIGQSLYYAHMTKRIPGIVLIIEKPSHRRYLKRLMPIAIQKKIRVWIITPNKKIQTVNYAHFSSKILPED